MNRFCHEAGKRVHGISVKAMAALTGYLYPGNLPELENVIRQLVYVCPAGQPIRHSMLPERLRIVVPVVLAIIFGMLLIMFRDLKMAIAVFLTVPLALTGGMAGLLLRGMPFSLSAIKAN